jgi:LPS sulfotransferase NodH
MFKRVFSVVLLLVLVLLLAGCAGNKPPKFALVDSHQGVSVDHPDQMAKETDKITVFPVVFHSFLNVECYNGYQGVWPVVAHRQGEPLKQGFAYINKEYSQNPFRFPIMEAVFLGGKSELKDYRIAIFNRDGVVWMFSPFGEVFSESDGYDSEKLEEDPEYRQKAFQAYGMKFSEVENSWKKLFRKHGVSVKQIVQEVKIGTPGWQELRKRLLSNFSEGYEMPNGEIRAGHFKTEEFRRIASQNPEITGWQRFFAGLRIPVVPSPEAVAFGAASSLINSGIQEMIPGEEWHGHTANSSCKRKDLAKQFRFISGMSKFSP